ncbi:hypothetical protein [Wolbachia endosymbiont of Ctenocephalides felis wCfeT]|uniref:hypothetical protein n=1 Tax=Wolbachia endosymbiont of Ctenocephalides felis wCfeT TaxID=2732593 RepID=UPI001444BD22|nr:hypothetical protein [Wolbachia endosymbiont of Ctenocephalides felis wCfeT]
MRKFKEVLENGANPNVLYGEENTPLMSIISAWSLDGNNEEIYKNMLDFLVRRPNININTQNQAQSNTYPFRCMA